MNSGFDINLVEFTFGRECHASHAIQKQAQDMMKKVLYMDFIP